MDQMKASARLSNKGEIHTSPKQKRDGNRNDNEGCEGNWSRDQSSPAEAGDRLVSTGTGLCGIRTRNKSGK